MNCVEYDLDLGDYVDGRLGADAAARFEQHLQSCAGCRALVVDLRALTNATRALEPHVPAPQVWSRIAAAIEAEDRRPRFFQWLNIAATGWKPVLSAAAIVLIVTGGAWLSFRDVASTTHRPQPIARATTGAPSPVEPVGTTLDAAEVPYVTTIATLEQITKTEGTALDEPTAAVVQENLAVLDQAIGESRQALRNDPSSDVAQESLFDALRTKVALLQDTVALINEMRKGDQEGAARIISGMNP
jgi:hypothetical protein